MTSTTDIERLQAIFEKALLTEKHHRKAYVEEACAGDERLINKVLRMVECATTKHVPVQEDVGVIASETEQKTSLVNTQIDKYRLIRRLGHGGMGEVYLAEIVDDEIQLQVVIKIICHDLQHKEIQILFQKEKQRLTDLQT